MTRYATIVADPPWEYERTSANVRCAVCGHCRFSSSPCKCAEPKFEKYSHALPYASMTLKEIRALPVASLAADDAHLYLWTTQRYLRNAFDIAYCWGFTTRLVLTWSKPPKGLSSGPFVNSSEFVLFASQGSPGRAGRHMGTVFDWPRGAHSAKPDAFLDIVEQVSPSPYVELFARRDRLGWDTWGDQALGTAEMGEAA